MAITYDEALKIGADDLIARLIAGVDTVRINLMGTRPTLQTAKRIPLDDLFATLNSGKNQDGTDWAGLVAEVALNPDDAIHLNDDVALTLGNTAAAPDAQLLWETADADAHYLNLVVSTSNNLIISEDAEIDWGIAASVDPQLILTGNDSTDVTEYGSIKYLAEGGNQQFRFVANAGSFRFHSAIDLYGFGDSGGNQTVRIRSGATGRSSFEAAEGDTTNVLFGAHNNFAQGLILTESGAGDQVILGNYAARGQDFDHAAQPDPTLFIHSITEPDTDNTEWMSFAHDQTNGVIATGKGDINLLSATGVFKMEDTSVANTTLRLNVASAGEGSLEFQQNATTVSAIRTNLNFDQMGVYSGGSTGRQFIIGNITGSSQDFDHAAPTDPTLFIHSATTPNTNNTQWGSLFHDQTDFRFDLGLGIYAFNNDVFLGAVDNAGTGTVNAWKVNTSDEVDVGAIWNLGTIDVEEDAGAVVLVDFSVSATPAAGTEESYSFAIDSNDFLRIFSEADSSGSVQNQSVQCDVRLEENQGADVASANDLTLGTDGNVTEITGAVQINAITTAGWRNGSMITLMFTSTPTVKHNTAGGGGTAVALLAGAADFVATAGDTLTLVLSEIGGTQAWREVSRAII